MSRDRGKIIEIIRVFRLAAARGFVSGTEGNGSIRTEEGIYVTRSGVSKGLLEPEDVLLVGEDGKLIDGEGDPTSELPTHLEIYRVRPDVRAVFHAHPPYSTAYTLLEEKFPLREVAELLLVAGEVPVVPYALPSSRDLADKVSGYAGESDVLLLERHGVIGLGSSILDAYLKVEMTESVLKTMMIARQVGKTTPLPEEEVERILHMRRVLKKGKELP
ncbi:MAG: class II aldolase/adducin family protein [Deltaproteobacteria bacterium]|nr:MAG: class II aldolase/adducin family protein [Deltaproteobacteria bacterium]